MNTTQRAEQYRLPIRTTPEELELRYLKAPDDTIMTYGERIIVAMWYFNPEVGKHWIGAVHEFVSENMTCEDEIELLEISEEPFEDDGHAIEWAINVDRRHLEKGTFCRQLCKLLQKTDQHKDLEDLIYQKDDRGEELVTPVWKTNDLVYLGTRINVTADSHTAMIKDILKGIE